MQNRAPPRSRGQWGFSFEAQIERADCEQGQFLLPDLAGTEVTAADHQQSGINSSICLWKERWLQSCLASSGYVSCAVKGWLAAAWFRDCFLEHVPVNLMVLLDCRWALICACFLGPLINWMLPGADGGGGSWWQAHRPVDSPTAPRVSRSSIFVPSVSPKLIFFHSESPVMLKPQAFVWAFFVQELCVTTAKCHNEIPMYFPSKPRMVYCLCTTARQ